MTVTPIPLMPGPWLPLAESEAQAFLERLNSVLVRSHGPAAFTKNLPISGLRVMPLSFYPGWLLVEGEAQLAPNELGTFNVLYGPGFMWVIDGDSQVIHDLNSGRIPDMGSLEDGKATNGGKVASPAFLPSPLIQLDTSVTGPDYLRFFCGSIWAEEGPFLVVESPDAAILQGAKFPDDTWRNHIKPITMKRVDDYLTCDAAVVYAGSLFSARATRDGEFVFQRDGTRLAYTTLAHQWQEARKRAGCMERLIHDLRRTAAREFRLAGVDEGSIMALCGWKTRAMFSRYNVLDDSDLAAAVAKRFNGTVAAQSEGSPADSNPLSSSPA